MKWKGLSGFSPTATERDAVAVRGGRPRRRLPSIFSSPNSPQARNFSREVRHRASRSNSNVRLSPRDRIPGVVSTAHFPSWPSRRFSPQKSTPGARWCAHHLTGADRRRVRAVKAVGTGDATTRSPSRNGAQPLPRAPSSIRFRIEDVNLTPFARIHRTVVQSQELRCRRGDCQASARNACVAPSIRRWSRLATRTTNHCGVAMATFAACRDRHGQTPHALDRSDRRPRRGLRSMR